MGSNQTIRLRTRFDHKTIINFFKVVYVIHVGKVVKYISTSDACISIDDSSFEVIPAE